MEERSGRGGAWGGGETGDEVSHEASREEARGEGRGGREGQVRRGRAGRRAEEEESWEDFGLRLRWGPSQGLQL